MADQTITVTIPTGQTVVAALGVIMTVEGRVVLGNQTTPFINNTTDPKALLMMLEQARNEVNKTPSAVIPLKSAKTLVRS